ncbi:hypothetical protein, partial [Thiolapillus sp.]|uniref:hypothetical protein n=1 Tax=Thiolapillus sp. TaxID=2017437 RepID=UPI003AF681AC
DVINNRTKFQLNRIRTLSFQLKLFDTALTLRRKWFEWVKLSDYYHHAKYDIYHIYSVPENHNGNVIATYGRSVISWIHIFHVSQKSKRKGGDRV